MSEDGSWVEREPDEVPEPAKPKRVKRVPLDVQQAVKEMERGMPRSEDAEKGILSVLLQEPDKTCPNARESIPPDYFYHVGNKLLYEEIIYLHASGAPVDLVTISQHLIDKGIMDKIGGPATLAELYNFVPTTAHYPYYRGILKDKWTLREILKGADKIKDCCHEGHETLEEVSKVVVTEATNMISIFDQEEKEQTLVDQLESWQTDFQERVEGKRVSAMPTRWSSLNTKMGGLDGGYTVVSGEYSAGKSVLLRNLMVDACLTQGRPGLLFNYETSVKQTISGMVCDISGVRTEIVFRPDRNAPSPAERKSIAWALGKIASSKLKIIHQPYLSAEGICHRAKSMKSKHGDVVVGVDYLQKIPRPLDIEKNANQERELARSSDTLQKGAKDTECPFIVCCQLNTGGTARGSMSINMDADTHYRIEGDDGIWVEKHKEGERFYHLPIFLNGSRLRFEEKTLDIPS